MRPGDPAERGSRWSNSLKMPKRKLFQIGNSVALTFPKDFLEDAGLNAGDKVVVEYRKETKTLLVRPKKQDPELDSGGKLRIWLRKFLRGRGLI